MNVWSSTVWLCQDRFCNLWGMRQIRTIEPVVHWGYVWKKLGFGNVTLCPNTVYIELNNSLFSQARCRRSHRKTWFKWSQLMGIQNQIQRWAVWAELLLLSSITCTILMKVNLELVSGLRTCAWTSCGAMVFLGLQCSDTSMDGWSRIQKKLDIPWG